MNKVQSKHIAATRNTRTRLRLVKRPSAVVAAERVLALIHEIGADENYRHGWQAYAARGLGISPDIVWCLVSGKSTRLGTVVIDQICVKLGITIAELMDEV